MDKHPKTPTRPSGIPRLATSRLPLPTSSVSRSLRPSPSRDKLQADPGLDATRLRRPSEDAVFKKPFPKYSSNIKPPERLIRRRDVSQAGTSDGGWAESEARSDAASTIETSAHDTEIRGRSRDEQPSLSDRTIETLSQIPPSPAPSRRQSSFFNGASPIRSPSRPSRPTSSMSSYSRSPSTSSTSRQQSGNNLFTQNPSVARLPSRSRVSAVPSLVANGSSSTDNGSIPAVESPSRLKMPSVRQSLGPDGLPSTAASKRPDVSPARHGLYSGGTNTTTAPKPRPAPGKTLAKPTVSNMGPPPQPLNVKKTRKTPSSSSSSTRLSTGSKTSSAASTAPESWTPEQEADRETRKVSKSSSALRESIAKAKAARKVSRQSSSQAEAGSVDPWDNIEDPFNQGPKDPNKGVLRKRLDIGRSSGSLNIAAMSLTEFPKEVMSMYDFDPESTTDWYESVDLFKFIAADNEFAELPESAFPDIDPNEFDPDVDEKGNQFGGLEVLDLHGNVLRSLPVGFRRLQRLHTLNLSGNHLAMDEIQIVMEMESLRDLKLAKNQLQGTFSSTISRLSNLELLDLSGNSLTKLPENISDLTSLRVLNVGHNQLTSLPFEALSKVPLKDLIASKNQLQGTLIPASVRRLETLQNLDVVSNALEKLSENESIDLPNLQSLSMSVNRIKVLPNVSCWQSLLSLLVEDNSLVDLPDGLVELKNIKTVDVTGNNISILDEKIGLMESLATLRVANNPLRDRKFLNMATDDIKRDLRNRCEPEVPDTDDEEGSVGTQFTLAPESPEQGQTAWQVRPGGILDRSYKDMHELEVDRLVHLDPHDVRCLYLQHNELRGFPIPALSMLANGLVELDLSNNPLDSSALFSSSLTLPNLQNLNLSATGLVSLEPISSNLLAPSLTFLDISCNRIAGSLPLIRRSYPKLIAFIASDNRFESLEFEAAQGLQVLDIGNNSIDCLPPKLGLLRSEGSSKNWDGGSALKRFEVAGNTFRVPRWQIVAKGTEAILEWLKDRIHTEDLAEWEPDGETNSQEY
ncbi:hypothetical protein MW887_007889 [Aspergillus wentii]|nr:hypothetical protein MW887_007889 [Aspergillus wentii]